jgi:predicted secreted protein
MNAGVMKNGKDILYNSRSENRMELISGIRSHRLSSNGFDYQFDQRDATGAVKSSLPFQLGPPFLLLGEIYCA